MTTDNRQPDTRWVPELVDRMLWRLLGQRVTVMTPGRLTVEQSAQRSARLAELSEREAAWLEVLARWVLRQHDMPRVLVPVTYRAAEYHREHASFWRGSAADWNRQAAGLPVCSVIGCTCGGVCEVPA